MALSWEALALFLFVIVSIVAIRFNATFDVNKFLDYRQRRRRAKLQAVCPHTVPIEVPVKGGTELRMETLAVDVSIRVESDSTTVTVCERCGTRLLGGLAQAEKRRFHFEQNPRAWSKQEKQYKKAAKKL